MSDSNDTKVTPSKPIKRPGVLVETQNPGMLMEHLKKFKEYHIAMGKRKELDKDYPVPANNPKPEPIVVKQPIEPTWEHEIDELEFDDEDDEAAERASRQAAMDRHTKLLEVYLMARKDNRAELESWEKDQQRYQSFRSAHDQQIAILETGFEEHKWKQVKNHPDFESEPYLWKAFEVIEAIFLDKDNTGMFIFFGKQV